MNVTFSIAFRQFMVVFLAVALLFLTCAHQVSPGGGPEDKTGPLMLATLPANGAVGIERNSRIAVSFSEWISKPSALKSISILPPLEGGSVVKVRGKLLEIIPARPLAASTTYHVVILSGLMDLRGNTMASPVTIIFSTGKSLDSGTVTGCVVGAEQGAVLPMAALFSVEGAKSGPQFFKNPDYLAQGDSAGYFSISNVRPGSYQIVAFTDKNNNRRLDPGIENAYAFSRPEISVSRQAVPLLLYPVLSDTSVSRLKSVKPVSSKALMCTWSGSVDSLHGCSEPAWSIVNAAGDGKGVPVSQTIWFDNKSRSALLLADTLSLAQYRIIAVYRRTLAASSVVIADTLLFNGTGSKDTVRPALQSFLPSGKTGLLPQVKMVFSEPVLLTGPLALRDSLGDSVSCIPLSRYADTVVLTPFRRLRPGNTYRMAILDSSGRDMAGNLLKTRDTTDTVATPGFSVIEPDSLALSLKGCAPCLPADSKRKWQYLPFRGNSGMVLSDDKNNCFSFDSIPAGKGFVAYFSDENGNNLPDRGMLSPFVSSEPYVILPDTVEARARWEIEGVTLTPCDHCVPKNGRSEEMK